ncbi:MAG: PAS domain-containing protein, partial [Pseudomonadota bacterium]
MTSRGTKYWNSGAIPLIAPELLGNIISMASDIAIVISPEARVLSVLINPNNRHFALADEWEGKDLRHFLTVESVPKLEEKLQLFSEGGETDQMVELNHTEDAKWEFPIRYSFHRIGPDGSLLLLGRDLRPIAEMQQQLVKAQLALERDYETQREFDTRFRVLMDTTREAMVFVALGSGRITEANAAAAQLMGVQRDTLVGSAFAQEFEGRRRSEFLESLTNAALSDEIHEVELRTRRGRTRVALTPRMFRAAGERLLICRIEAIDNTEAASDELSENLS